MKNNCKFGLLTHVNFFLFDLDCMSCYFNVMYKILAVLILSPSKYSSVTIRLSHLSFHWSQHCWKSLAFRFLRRLLNCFHVLPVHHRFANKKVTSGRDSANKYGRTVIKIFVRNSRTISAKCALSWWKIQSSRSVEFNRTRHTQSLSV